ncbi:MARVEL domain-containing protein sing [Lycorma delicatula]|uniref:MARVEL domain-containing protein sing n=1 Tax=Lycorma delicatula TaxID=130591 RepID=UPI003F50EE14
MGSRVISHPGTIIYRTARNNTSLKSCFPCLNVQFLQTLPGVLKLAQAIVGGMCETLMLNYGLPYAQIIGASFLSLMTISIASVFTVSLLLICYIMSQNTYSLVRASLFELLFNLAAAVSYCSSSCFMLIAVKLYLYPLYLITLGFVAYPAMCAAYGMGFFLATVHALDAYHSYKAFKGIL